MSDVKTNSNKESHIESQNESQGRTIFSQDEVLKIVKGFVLAYLRGIITINFPNIAFYKKQAEAKKEQFDYDGAMMREATSKQRFSSYIEIVSGTKPSTPQELQNTINQLFHEILKYRSSKRIQGTFLEYKMEERLEDLERKLNATNNVVEQLVRWLTDEAKGNEKLP